MTTLRRSSLALAWAAGSMRASPTTRPPPAPGRRPRPVAWTPVRPGRVPGERFAVGIADQVAQRWWRPATSLSPAGRFFGAPAPSRWTAAEPLSGSTGTCACRPCAVSETIRKTAPLAAVLGHVQDRVQHLDVRQDDVPGAWEASARYARTGPARQKHLLRHDVESARISPREPVVVPGQPRAGRRLADDVAIREGRPCELLRRPREPHFSRPANRTDSVLTDSDQADNRRPTRTPAQFTASGPSTFRADDDA